MENSKNLNAAVPLHAIAHSEAVRLRRQEQPQNTLSPWDLVYTVAMAIACLITYWIMTHALCRLVDKPSDLLGGMWAGGCGCIRFQRNARPEPVCGNSAV